MAYATVVWVVVVVVVAAGVAGVGFYAGYEYRGSPAVNVAVVENRTLSVLGAGTLKSFFSTLAGDLVNETPNVSAPGAAQTYEGSLDVTTAITSLAAKTDVAAVADFRLIPSLLEPKFASYEVVFASTPEVLVYNPSFTSFDGINTTNWGTLLPTAVADSGKPFAVWNQSTDPNGYNEIFSMMLQGMLYGSGATSVLDNFYTMAPSGYEIPKAAPVTENEHESAAASLIQDGTVSALITYRSYAIANDLTFVPLDPVVGLSSNTTAALADYAKLSTEILNSTLALVPVSPAPVLFGATVPLNAPNASLGAAFLHLLVSPQGDAVLSAGGAFTPIFPAWSDNPKGVPSVLAPDVTSLPSWASGYLT